MLKIVLLTVFAVFCFYQLKKSLHKEMRPKKNKGTSKSHGRIYTKQEPDEEMSEEEMIAEDYYYYKDRD